MTAITFPKGGKGNRPITVALVNNMPDSAFVDTENQFRGAALAGSATGVEFELYTITEIPRSDNGCRLIEARYRGLDELWTRPPDALIVTGTEPTQVQMRFEPYWPYLARLLEWAADHVPTTLLSCLASHASILLFDGIERVPRAGQVQRRVRRRRRGPVRSAGCRDFPRPSRSRIRESMTCPRRRSSTPATASSSDRGVFGRRLVGGGPRRGRRAVRALPGPSGVRHAEPAAGVPPRRPPLPVRPGRSPVSASARWLSRPGGGGPIDGVRAASEWRGHGSTRAVAKLPVRRGRARRVENTWASASATLYANWLRWRAPRQHSACLTWYCAEPRRELLVSLV